MIEPQIHVVIALAEKCYATDFAYREICIHCNACGKLDPKTMWKARLWVEKQRLLRDLSFDDWSKHPHFAALQKKRNAENIAATKRRIAEIKRLRRSRPL